MTGSEVSTWNWEPEKEFLTSLAGRAGAVAKYVEAVARRRDERAAAALGRAVDTSGLGVEDFFALVEADERKAQLLALALEAASRATLQQKIEALGRAVAAGVLAADDATVDEVQLVVATLAELEAPHIRALIYLDEAEAMERRSPRDVVRERFGGDVDVSVPVVAALTRLALFEQGPPGGDLSYGPAPADLTKFGRRVLSFLREVGEKS